ncbi:hypothetical protein [Streptomyces sp. NPDC048639]|uniref:hypothetical protein n=1 Tax=Streptomyces sp. NPDC048639 TaxID=3365581 RepID=UPI00371F0B71
MTTERTNPDHPNSSLPNPGPPNPGAPSPGDPDPVRAHENSRPVEGSDPVFGELMADVMASAEHFGHREHIRLTWLAVHHVGMPAAIDLISDGIRRTARYAGAPQKYNATVSRAWVELVAHHAAEEDTRSFPDLVGRNPALLDKRLLGRFYRSGTLARPEARTGWVEPDLAPFPWATD